MAVHPSFTSRYTVAFQYTHCACVICRSLRTIPWSQKLAEQVRLARLIIWRALCSTQRVHRRPPRKQSQPSRSWNRDSTPNLDPGLSNEVSVRVLCARRYLLNRYFISLSVCWSTSHWTSCSTDSANTREWLASSWQPQLGQTFWTDLDIRKSKSWWFVPWK